MKNMQMTVAGDILTITVDMAKEFGPSSPGRRSSSPRPRAMSRCPHATRRSG
jgi:hypothetical protein